MSTKVLSAKNGQPKANLESPPLQETIPVVATSYRPSADEIAGINPATVSQDEIELAISWAIATNSDADPSDDGERNVIRDIYTSEPGLMVEDVLHYRHSLAESAPSDLPTVTEITPSQSSSDPLPSPSGQTTTMSAADVAALQKANFTLATNLAIGLSKRETLTHIQMGELLQAGFDAQRPYIAKGGVKDALAEYLADFRRVYRIGMASDPRSLDSIRAFHVYRLVDGPSQERISPAIDGRPFPLDTILTIGEWLAYDAPSDVYSIREGFENAICEVCMAVGDNRLSAADTRDLMESKAREIELLRIETLQGKAKQDAERDLKKKKVADRSAKVNKLMDTVKGALGKILPIMGSSELLVELERAGILVLDAKPIDPATVSPAKAAELAEGLCSHENAAAIAVMMAKFQGFAAAQMSTKISPTIRESLSDMPTIAKPDVFVKPAPSRHHELFSLLGQHAALQPAQSN